MDGSRGQRMLMAALNKTTKQLFSETSTSDILKAKESTRNDPDYIPDSDSTSEDEETPVGVDNFSNVNYVNNEAVLFELQPMKTDLPNVEIVAEMPELPETENNLEPDRASLNINITDGQENGPEYTKKGTIRKRKKYNMSLIERKKLKFDLVIQKHAVKSGCGNACALKCETKIPTDRRAFINEEFWKIDDSAARKSFMLHHVSDVPVKQRTVHIESKFKRNRSFKYSLKDSNGTAQTVCKTFFLTTLGYEKTNDKVLRNVLSSSKNSVIPTKDKRCLAPPHNKIDDEPIRNHINSFRPTISHYRREHAPNRLYLASDLSFTLMHNDFKSKYGNICSYEKYRTVAKRMNISIVKLGHEQCETCEEFEMHSNIHSKENLDQSCEVCKTWKNHKDRAEKSRTQYMVDKDKEENLDDVIYCADLEKVIMLPRLDMFKTAIFTHRIVVYNESFVPIGKKQKNSKIFAALWHEGMFGRSKDELISTFYQFVLSKRDTNRITIWLDNCTSQNKNWSLFSFFLNMINSEEIVASEIVLKYFEPGHTFMAADSFHHRVELSMQRMGNKLYDFQDFVTAVKNTSPKTEAFQMDLNNFFSWQDYSSNYKLGNTKPRPYLHNMVEVVFTRGLKTMKYKNDFTEDEFIVLDFLGSKITKAQVFPGPTSKTKFNGIPVEKKTNILKNLGGIIEKNRLKFWENIPQC